MVLPCHDKPVRAGIALPPFVSKVTVSVRPSSIWAWISCPQGAPSSAPAVFATAFLRTRTTPDARFSITPSAVILPVCTAFHVAPSSVLYSIVVSKWCSLPSCFPLIVSSVLVIAGASGRAASVSCAASLSCMVAASVVFAMTERSEPNHASLIGMLPFSSARSSSPLMLYNAPAVSPVSFSLM